MPFIEANDLRINYIERGQGQPVLFVHGNWSTALSWQPTLDRLPEGYRGIAYDVRGRGRTEGPDNDYTMPELAGDLLAFADALALEKFHLVGHSLGSAIALQFALEHAERLKSLTVVAPAWVDGMPTAYNAPAAQETLKSNKAIFSQAYRAMMPTLNDEAFFQELVDEGHEQRLAATLRNLPALVDWHPGDALSEIGVPSIVISGELDVLTGGANAERAAAALDARHITMQGVGHSPNIESPDNFGAFLTDFLVSTERDIDPSSDSFVPPYIAKESIRLMETESQLGGVTSQSVQTDRLLTHFFSAGSADGVPVVLIHGNVSSALFWDMTIPALAQEYRVIAPDLRGYGDTEPLPLDATRGLRDWSDDLKSLADTLNLGKFHIVGWSMGAGVAMQYAIDHSSDLLSITLMSPLSPYGFGGTKDAQGTPVYFDFAGSGGGTVNPEFLRLLAAEDRTDSSPATALSTMNAFYFKPPFRVPEEREQMYVTSMLSTRLGDDHYPGDMTTSPNWPTVAPGTKGINNTMAPNYCDLSAFADIEPKPPVLWVRGADDQIVSDTSFFDFGFLGQLGAVPGWPGADVFPPQPMVSQTREVLDRYRASGGQYQEVVITDCGHSPHVEKPEEFNSALLNHIQA